jgi:O-antigen/teichoic acid export membrane protein
MFPQKEKLKQNIIANFVGQGISFLVGIVVVPFYIRYLGIEGYGLVGFYAILQSVFNSFLDFGFSVTINRELARFTASPDNNQTLDLVRTIEIGYWLIGLVLGILVCLSAPLVSLYWLNPETISSSTIQTAVFIMGVITFVQWPLTLYQGGLLGLQKMVMLNILNAILMVLRGAGGILVLRFYPIVTAFFIWQLTISVLQVGLTAVLLWRNLPISDYSPRFTFSLLKNIWRFAAGMTATSFFSFFADYGGRILLSKILSLEYFGYYSLATTLNDQLQLISAPIHRALFPQFSTLVAKNDNEALRNLYHKASQYVSVSILPIIGTVVVFASELIFIWTQDINIMNKVAPIAALLFMGTIFSSLAGVPYTLTLAYGWAKPGFYRAVIAFFLLIPLTIIMSLRYEGVGAAFAWTLFNFGYLIMFPTLIHRKLLMTEFRYWAMMDIGIPVFVSSFILVAVSWVVPADLSMIQIVFIVPLVFVLVFVCTFLVAHDIRGSVITYLKRVLSVKYI